MDIKLCSNTPNKQEQCFQLDSQVLLANSLECWSVSVSVPPEWKLLASEELQDAEWLMVGLMGTCLSPPEDLDV